MGISHLDEHADVQSVVREFLAGVPEDGALLSDGWDKVAWTRMTRELGLAGIAVPETYGGAGGAFTEVAAVLEETGRSLASLPYLATVAAAHVLCAVAPAPVQSRWLPSIVEGSATAALALGESSRSFGVSEVRTTASSSSGDWVLSGAKSFVIDGASADLLVVTALDETGDVALFTVDGGEPGLTRQPLETIDLTRQLAHLQFDEVRADMISEPGQGCESAQLAIDVMLCSLAAEQVGGAQMCLDMSVAYAKTRTQFGRLIGSFQAIKHSCADMWIEVEASRSAARHASSMVATAGVELSIAAAVAKSYCSRAFTDVAKRNIQIHGGVGFTWEHPAHRYLKRAKSGELLCGVPDHHRSRIAALTGIEQAR